MTSVTRPGTFTGQRDLQHTHPFDSKLLDLVVFPLEQLLHVFENAAGSVQVS